MEVKVWSDGTAYKKSTKEENKVKKKLTEM